MCYMIIAQLVFYRTFNMKLMHLVVIAVCVAFCAAATTIANGLVKLPSEKNAIRPRIIDVKAATKGQFPYFAPIVRCDTISFVEYYCGGVILNSRYVLSGGCLGRIPWPFGQACLGGGMIRLERKDQPNIPIESDTKEYRKTPMEWRYNLVLFKTYYDIKFNEFVQPIALPTEKWSHSEQNKVVSMGFGDMSYAGAENRLLYAEPSIISLKECAERLNGNPEKEFLSNFSVMCTTQKQASIYADIGSPLVDITNPKKPILIGIASRPILGDNALPAIYVRAYEHVDWIHANMK